MEGPLVRELREIGEGSRDFPVSTARRHHYVPAFVLAKFATPRGDRRAFMAQLDTRTGRPGKTTPHDSCFEKDLYAQRTDEGRDNTLESFFSIVERHSAPALARLTANPLGLTQEDRETLSYYLAFQYVRSPGVLGQLGAMAEALELAMLAVHVEDATSFQRFYRETLDADATDIEIESSRQSMKEHLKRGEIQSSDPQLHAVQAMLTTSDGVAETIHQMQWTLIESEGDEFVISDRALAIYDPTPRFPWSGAALESSSYAQTTVPIAPEYALLLEPGPPRVGRATADATYVRRVNLRTYGWAERFIYGRTQAIVQNVRGQAKRFRKEIVRPRPMRQIILEEADPNDPSVGREHVRRGWPRGLWVPDDGGRRKFASYTVLDAAELRRGEAARAGASAGRRVISGAIADGLASPDRLGPDDARSDS
jgi:hypothetical protein